MSQNSLTTRSRQTLAESVTDAASVQKLNTEQLKQAARGVIQMLLLRQLTRAEAEVKSSLIIAEASRRAGG